MNPQNEIVALVLTGGNGSVTTPEDAVKLRDVLLLSAETIQNVTSPKSQEIAVEVLSKIKGTLAVVEETRTKIKAPVLKLGKAIDDAAKTFVKKLTEEELRLGSLVLNFQRIELQKQRAAEEAQAKALRAMVQAPTRQAAAAIPIAPLPAPAKATGQSVGTKWTYRVIDVNALYKARPDLCRPIEVSLAGVNAAIANGARQIPGLEIYEDVKSVVRAS